ncbi:hypothetical protein HTZ84_05315 [Haloterrigena sp. SYSU A558-1]|uniref:Uncharacterized protein n=1 Tax=Haloterrigena gelatinilytica TaxID=2741724 RepID=A0ABX2LBL7_9EURY|nr:hypothetical protein [Haloterrigena gelatinilytica]NUC71733.1 hypothetical protein [Haloterrigena gelatinilytica]
MPFNGPRYEPSPDLPDGLSYCVQCGTVMVFHSQRDCPACTLNERLEKVEEQLDALEGDDETIAEHIVDSHEAIDDRLEDLERRLDRAERDIDIVDGGL